MTKHEERLQSIIHVNFPEVPIDSQARMASRLASDPQFRHLPADDDAPFIERIAQRLVHRLNAEAYGAPTIPRDDPRLTAVAAKRRADLQAQADAHHERQAKPKPQPMFPNGSPL